MVSSLFRITFVKDFDLDLILERVKNREEESRWVNRHRYACNASL